MISRVIFVSISLLASVVLAETSGNILKDGGFENGFDQSDWSRKGNFYKGKGKAEIVQENPEGGLQCLQVVGGTRNSAYQLISRNIPVAPGSVMELSFAARSAYPEAIKDSAKASIHFYNAKTCIGQYSLFIKKAPESPNKWVSSFSLSDAGKNLGEYISKNKSYTIKRADLKKDISLTPKRKSINGIFKIPEGVKFIRLYLVAKGAGVVCFDNVSLKVLSLPDSVKENKASKKERGASAEENKKILGISDESKDSSDLLDKLDKLEMQRLLFENGDDISTPKKVPGWTYEIEKPEFVQEDKLPKASASDFPSRGQNITIKNGCFYRNGKPAYLQSYEDTYLFNFWFWQATGIDVSHIGDFYIRCSIKNEVRDKEKKIIVRMKDYPMASFTSPLTLASGVAPYLQPCETELQRYYRAAMRKNPNKKVNTELALYRYFPELFVTNGHFMAYRPGNKDAEKIRENAWRQYFHRASRFPAFACETFNELYYMDYSKSNFDAFAKQMKEKYKELEKFNKANKCEFSKWDSVLPPLMKPGDGKTLDDLFSDEHFSANLWTEWVKFTENASIAFLKRFYHFVKKLDPKVYVTIQPRPSADFDGELVGSDFHRIIDTYDFYAHEYSCLFYKTLSGKDVDETILRRMVHSRLRLESTRLACELAKKPILNVEGKIAGGVVITEDEKKACEIISLDGEWKFMPDEEEKGMDAKFFESDFDDSNWDKIKVPGLWTEQGKKNYKSAWCRKKVKLPEKCPEKIWLCGFKLSDRVNIFINGKLAHSTRGWSEKFDVDVTPFIKKGKTNSFAIQFFVDGIGGVREYLKLSSKSFKAQALQPEQLRAGLWTDVVHGTNGDAFSYRGPRGRFNAFVNPENTSPEAIANIPFVKAELDALASIIMPKPRFPSQIGVVLSMDTKREIVNKNALELGRRYYGHAFADYLGASWWTGLGAETVTDELIRNGAWKRYRIIVLPLAWRTHPKTFKALKEFVKDGGILIVGAGSMSKNDVTGMPLKEATELTGVNMQDGRCDDFLVEFLDSQEKWPARKFELTGESGVKMQLSPNAILIAKDDKGAPALVKNKYGKGLVYTLGFHPDMALFGKVLNKIIKEAGLLPQLELKSLEGPPCKYIERQVMGQNGRYLFYAQDYGGSRKLVKIKPLGFKLPDGKYTVTDTQMFKVIPSPSGKKIWDSKEIKNGISCLMEEQNPVCLLIENVKLVPTKPYNLALAKKRSSFLLKHFRPSPKSEKIAYIPSVTPFTEIDSIPTARLIMEELGFQVDAGFSKGVKRKLKAYGNRKYSLDKVSLLILIGTRYMTEEEADIIAEYVENGGALLVAGMPVWGNNWHTNRLINKLLKKWGLSIANTTLLEPETNGIVSRIAPVYNVASDHPAMRGVKKICAYAPSWISSKKSDLLPLFSSSDKAENIRPWGSRVGSKPLCFAFEQGKGRVLVIGTLGMLTPEYLRRADNAKFLANAVQWLTKKQGKDIPENKMKELLEIPGRSEFIKK